MTIEPYAYLRYLLIELPHADSLDKLEAQQPSNMKDRIASLKTKGRLESNYVVNFAVNLWLLKIPQE